MPEPDKTIFVDEDIASQILSLFRLSRRYVVVATPYLDLWGHLKNAVVEASAQKVELTFVLRDEAGTYKSEDVAWLRAHNVRVRLRERLHAKVYLNESLTFVSSMNLTESSATNSLEIAIRLSGQQEEDVRNYVFNRLLPSASEINVPRIEKAERLTSKGSGHHTLEARQVGHCVRCGRGMSLNPEKPLCDACYDVWAQWEDGDYPENVCHSCGAPPSASSPITKDRTLCPTCYRAAVAPRR